MNLLADDFDSLVDCVDPDWQNDLVCGAGCEVDAFEPDDIAAPSTLEASVPVSRIRDLLSR